MSRASDAANRQEYDVIEIVVFLDPPEEKKYVERYAKEIVQGLTRRGWDARVSDIRGPEQEVEE